MMLSITECKIEVLDTDAAQVMELMKQEVAGKFLREEEDIDVEFPNVKLNLQDPTHAARRLP